VFLWHTLKGCATPCFPSSRQPPARVFKNESLKWWGSQGNKWVSFGRLELFELVRMWQHLSNTWQPLAHIQINNLFAHKFAMWHAMAQKFYSSIRISKLTQTWQRKESHKRFVLTLFCWSQPSIHILCDSHTQLKSSSFSEEFIQFFIFISMKRISSLTWAFKRMNDVCEEHCHKHTSQKKGESSLHFKFPVEYLIGFSNFLVPQLLTKFN